MYIYIYPPHFQCQVCYLFACFYLFHPYIYVEENNKTKGKYRLVVLINISSNQLLEIFKILNIPIRKLARFILNHLF